LHLTCPRYRPRVRPARRLQGSLQRLVRQHLRRWTNGRVRRRVLAGACDRADSPGMRFLSRFLNANSSDPKWLGAVASFAMGMGVSAIDLAITSPAVASRAAFAMDAAASALFLLVLIVFRERLPNTFFQLVTATSTGLITLT